MKVIDNIVTWLDDRTGLKQPIIEMATHLVPPGSKWFYVFGTAILTSFIVQLTTGVALSTMYVPSAGEAYESVRYMTTQAPFGSFVRAMHYFGASSMIMFVAIHMMRTYLMGAYKFPRELNWLSGVVLFFFTLAMGFTGQVLRWDQNSIWTVAVGAEQALRAPFVGRYISKIMLSGDEIGSSMLSHFFAIHVFVFPGIVIAVIGLHLWLVLRNGISEPPKVGEPVDPKTYKETYAAMLKRVGKPFCRRLPGATSYSVPSLSQVSSLVHFAMDLHLWKNRPIPQSCRLRHVPTGISYGTLPYWRSCHIELRMR